MTPCIFCNIPPQEIILKNQLGYARYDKYPVNQGHVLIVPFRHIKTYFDADDSEKATLWELVEEAKGMLDKQFHPDGYNIGINVGEAAGQTVMHLHIHLIPRYVGDVANPRGGVRGVIPSMQDYRKPH
ncbi:MAG: HIT family protein [SAR324 cluster bacterium]|nr:HIT family protein [SAR324 cluster bacterium]